MKEGQYETMAPDRLQLPFSVPAELAPEKMEDMFPRLTPEHVRVLVREGYAAVGVVTVIVGPDNRVLALRHKGSEKVPDGAFGFISETSRGIKKGDSSSVEDIEQIPETIRRALAEEIGLTSAEIAALRFTAHSKGAYCLIPWPVKNKTALGFVVVLHADQDTVGILIEKMQSLQNGTGTKEIQGGDFFKWTEAGKTGGPWRNAPLVISAAHRIFKNDSPMTDVSLPDHHGAYADDMTFS